MLLVAANVDTDVDGMRHEQAGSWIDDLLNELANTVEHRSGVVRVDGRHTSGMAGIPRLKELEGGAVADFPYQNAVGSVPHRIHHGALPCVDGGLNEHLKLVAGLALKLGRVLDDVHAVFGVLGDHFEESVRECGLSRSGATADEDIGVRCDGFEKRIVLKRG